MKNILLNCLSVRSSTGTGVIPISEFFNIKMRYFDGVNLSIPPPKSINVWSIDANSVMSLYISRHHRDNRVLT